jgi:hypothetical protein
MKKISHAIVYNIKIFTYGYSIAIYLLDRRMSIGQYVTEIGDVVSHFNITKVQVEDGGLYECIVSNRAGQVSHSAKLQVYGTWYL